MKAVGMMTLLFGLAACSQLDTHSPANVDLSGTWQIDEHRSDSAPPLGRRSSAEIDEQGGYPPGGTPRFDGPMPLLPMLSAREMTIAQDALSMGVDYPGEPYRDVKWGSQKRGLFTVNAGWEEQRLIVETKSDPLRIRETYSLSESGDTLTLHIDLNGKRMNDRHLTRVFTRVPVSRP